VSSLRIEKLQRSHAIDAFDCGREALNLFLIRYAFQNRQAEASQTYVALSDELVGYYTLVVGQVEYNDAPGRPTKGPARHPVPIMLLAPATDGEHLRSAPTVRLMLHGFPGRSRHDQSLKYRNLATQ
jgi:hypothetical protein